jgi:thiol:disulfide interchange protein
MRCIILALSLTVVLSACAQTKKDSASEPEKASVFQKLTEDKAIAKAKAENKIVMIDFYAEWCDPCKAMENETFSQAKVRDFLKEHMIAIRVNIDNNVELARKYKVRSIPCIVFVDGKGNEVGRFVGYRDADEFLSESREALK